MVSLGYLEIGLGLNKTQFDSDLRKARKDLENLYQVNLTRKLIIRPVVDHGPLVALNKHLDQKEAHRDRLNRKWQNNPLTITTDTTALDRLEQQLKELKALNNDFNAKASSNISIDHRFNDRDTKVVNEIKNLTNVVIKVGNSNKKGIIGNIFTGFLQGIGGYAGIKTGRGITKGLDIDLEGQGKELGKYIDGKVKKFKVAIDTGLSNLLGFPEGLKTAQRLTVKNLNAILDNVSDPKFYQDLEDFFVAFNQAGSDVFAKGNLSKSQQANKRIFEESRAKIVNRFSEVVEEDIARALGAIITGFAQPLRIRKRVQLKSSAEMAVRQEELFRKEYEQRLIKERIATAESILLFTGGVAPAESKPGVPSVGTTHKMAAAMQAVFPRSFVDVVTPANTVSVEELQQSLTSQLKTEILLPFIKEYREVLANFLDEKTINNLIGNLSQFHPLEAVLQQNIDKGYNTDSIRLATKALSAALAFPDKPITLASASGGGFIVEEAIAILNEIAKRYPELSKAIKRVKGFAIGTPIANLTQTSYTGDPTKDLATFRAFIGTYDNVGKGFFGNKLYKNDPNLSPQMRSDLEGEIALPADVLNPSKQLQTLIKGWGFKHKVENMIADLGKPVSEFLLLLSDFLRDNSKLTSQQAKKLIGVINQAKNLKVEDDLNKYIATIQELVKTTSQINKQATLGIDTKTLGSLIKGLKNLQKANIKPKDLKQIESEISDFIVSNLIKDLNIATVPNLGTKSNPGSASLSGINVTLLLKNVINEISKIKGVDQPFPEEIFDVIDPFIKDIATIQAYLSKSAEEINLPVGDVGSLVQLWKSYDIDKPPVRGFKSEMQPVWDDFLKELKALAEIVPDAMKIDEKGGLDFANFFWNAAGIATKYNQPTYAEMLGKYRERKYSTPEGKQWEKALLAFFKLYEKETEIFKREYLQAVLREKEAFKAGDPKAIQRLTELLKSSKFSRLADVLGRVKKASNKGLKREEILGSLVDYEQLNTFLNKFVDGLIALEAAGRDNTEEFFKVLGGSGLGISPQLDQLIVSSMFEGFQRIPDKVKAEDIQQIIEQKTDATTQEIRNAILGIEEITDAIYLIYQKFNTEIKKERQKIDNIANPPTIEETLKKVEPKPIARVNLPVPEKVKVAVDDQLNKVERGFVNFFNTGLSLNPGKSTPDRSKDITKLSDLTWGHIVALIKKGVLGTVYASDFAAKRAVLDSYITGKALLKTAEGVEKFAFGVAPPLSPIKSIVKQGALPLTIGGIAATSPVTGSVVEMGVNIAHHLTDPVVNSMIGNLARPLIEIINGVAGRLPFGGGEQAAAQMVEIVLAKLNAEITGLGDAVAAALGAYGFGKLERKGAGDILNYVPDKVVGALTGGDPNPKLLLGLEDRTNEALINVQNKFNGLKNSIIKLSKSLKETEDPKLLVGYVETINEIIDDFYSTKTELAALSSADRRKLGTEQGQVTRALSKARETAITRGLEMGLDPKDLQIKTIDVKAIKVEADKAKQEAKTNTNTIKESVNSLVKTTQTAIETIKNVLKPGDTAKVNLGELNLDPGRFQYKIVHGKTGSTGSLSGVKEWDEDYSGVVSVWRDPKDGKLYVVNGHNRVSLAKDLNVKEILVKLLDVPTAEEARAKGAMINIAGGHGTALDAAKFMIEQGLTSKEQVKKFGIPLKDRIATQGLSLAQLPPDLFQRVALGELPEARGIQIGGSGLKAFEQRELLKLIEQAEKRGKKLTEVIINELIDTVKTSLSQTVEQMDLFGRSTEIQSLALTKAEIQGLIKRKLSRDKRLFGLLGKNRNAEDLSRTGNQINVGANAEVAKTADVALTTFDQLKNLSGPIGDLLNQATEEASKGVDLKKVVDKIYPQILELIPQLAKGSQKVGNDISEGLAQGIQGSLFEVKESARKLGETPEKIVRDETETQSPSKAFIRIARDIVKGLIIGLRQTNELFVASSNLGTVLEKGLNQRIERHSPPKLFERIGRQIIQALVNGILRDRNQVKQAMKTVFDDALPSGMPTINLARIHQYNNHQTAASGILTAGRQNPFAIPSIREEDILSHDEIEILAQRARMAGEKQQQLLQATSNLPSDFDDLNQKIQEAITKLEKTKQEIRRVRQNIEKELRSDPIKPISNQNLSTPYQTIDVSAIRVDDTEPIINNQLLLPPGLKGGMLSTELVGIEKDFKNILKLFEFIANTAKKTRYFNNSITKSNLGDPWIEVQATRVEENLSQYLTMSGGGSGGGGKNNNKVASSPDDFDDLNRRLERAINRLEQQKEKIKKVKQQIDRELGRDPVSQGQQRATQTRDYWQQVLEERQKKIRKVFEELEKAGGEFSPRFVGGLKVFLGNVDALISQLPTLGTTIKGIDDAISALTDKNINLGKAVKFGVGAFALFKSAEFLLQPLLFSIQNLPFLVQDAIGQSLNLVKELEQVEINFKIANIGNVQSEIDNLIQRADDLGISFRSSLGEYSQFRIVTTNSPLQEQSENIFEGFQAGLAARQTNPEQQRESFRAVRQIASRPRVSLEEFTQQLTESGGLTDALVVAARSMGLTTQEFYRQADAGNILSEDLLPRLANQYKLLSASALATSTEPLQARLNILQNQAEKLQLQFGEMITPTVKVGISTLNQLLKFLNNNFELVNLVGMAGFIKLILFLGGSVKQFIAGIRGGVLATALLNTAFELTTVGANKAGLSILAAGTRGSTGMQLLAASTKAVGISLLGLASSIAPMLALTAVSYGLVKIWNAGSQELKDTLKVLDEIGKNIDNIKEKQGTPQQSSGLTGNNLTDTFFFKPNIEPKNLWERATLFSRAPFSYFGRAWQNYNTSRDINLTDRFIQGGQQRAQQFGEAFKNPENLARLNQDLNAIRDTISSLRIQRAEIVSQRDVDNASQVQTKLNNIDEQIARLQQRESKLIEKSFGASAEDLQALIQATEQQRTQLLQRRNRQDPVKFTQELNAIKQLLYTLRGYQNQWNDAIEQADYLYQRLAFNLAKLDRSLNNIAYNSQEKVNRAIIDLNRQFAQGKINEYQFNIKINEANLQNNREKLGNYLENIKKRATDLVTELNRQSMVAVEQSLGRVGRGRQKLGAEPPQVTENVNQRLTRLFPELKEKNLNFYEALKQGAIDPKSIDDILNDTSKQLTPKDKERLEMAKAYLTLRQQILEVEKEIAQQEKEQLIEQKKRLLQTQRLAFDTKLTDERINTIQSGSTRRSETQFNLAQLDLNSLKADLIQAQEELKQNLGDTNEIKGRINQIRLNIAQSEAAIREQQYDIIKAFRELSNERTFTNRDIQILDKYPFGGVISAYESAQNELDRQEKRLQQAYWKQAQRIDSGVEIEREILDTQKAIAQARSNLAQSQMAVTEYWINLGRQVQDFNVQVRSFQRSLEDAAISAAREVRGLTESYDDLMRELGTSLKNVQNQLEDNREKLQNQLAKNQAYRGLELGIGNNLYRQVTDAVFNIIDQFAANRSEKRQLSTQADEITDQYISTMRRIRDLQEQQLDVERNRLRTIQDLYQSQLSLNRILEDLMRALKKELGYIPQLGLDQIPQIQGQNIPGSYYQPVTSGYNYQYQGGNYQQPLREVPIQGQANSGIYYNPNTRRYEGQERTYENTNLREPQQYTPSTGARNLDNLMDAYGLNKYVPGYSAPTPPIQQQPVYYPPQSQKPINQPVATKPTVPSPPVQRTNITLSGRAQIIVDWATKHGFSPAAIAATLGNFRQEGTDNGIIFNPYAYNEGSGAYGIAQWLGSRKTNLNKKYPKTGNMERDLRNQLDFARSELSPSQLRRLQQAKTIDEAMGVWNGWERWSGWQRGRAGREAGNRYRYAEDYYRQFGNQSSIPGVELGLIAQAGVSDISNGLLPPMPELNYDESRQQLEEIRDIQQQNLETQKQLNQATQDWLTIQGTDQLRQINYSIQDQLRQAQKSLRDSIISVRELTQRSKGYLSVTEQIKKAGQDVANEYDNQIFNLRETYIQNQRLIAGNKQQLDTLRQIAATQTNPEVRAELEKTLQVLQLATEEYSKQNSTIQQQIELLQGNKPKAVQTAESRADRDLGIDFKARQLDLSAQLSEAQYNRGGVGGGLFNRGEVLREEAALLRERLQLEKDLEPFLEKNPQQVQEMLSQFDELSKIRLEDAFARANPFIGAFEDALTSIITQSDSAGEALRRLGIALLDVFLKQLVIKPLGRVLGTAFGGIFGGGFGGFSKGGKVGNYAEGGLVSSNELMGDNITEENMLGRNAIKAFHREKLLNGGKKPVLAALTEGEYVVPVPEVPEYLEYKKNLNAIQKSSNVQNFANGGIVGNPNIKYPSGSVNNSNRNTVNKSVNVENNIEINLESRNDLGYTLNQIDNRNEVDMRRAQRRLG